jgi:hypothetical protein
MAAPWGSIEDRAGSTYSVRRLLPDGCDGELRFGAGGDIGNVA